MDISLGFTSSTTMGMVASVHGHTTDCRPDIKPTGPSGFSKLPILIIGVAGDSYRCAAVLVNQPDLTTLESNCNVLGGALHLLPLTLGQLTLRLSAILSLILLLLALQLVGALGNDSCKCPRSPAKLTTLSWAQSNIEYQRSHRDHMQG